MDALKNSIEGLEKELLQVEANVDEYLLCDRETGTTAEILSAVRSARGKMLRPVLLLLAGRIGPDYPACRPQLCKLAALVEIIHMASLVHDDIVDDSPLRRGRPTAQSRFGKDMAVYAGDYMLCRGMYQLFKEGQIAAGLLLTQTMEEMCRGEIGQYSCRWDTETTLDQYLGNIYGKTVALFVAACQLGAMASGCNEAAVIRMGRVGEHLGYIFQMRDDMLDFVSSEQREGKPVHKDFADGIYTMPVLAALADPACGGRLRAIAAQGLGGENGAQLAQEMHAIVCASGGLAFTSGEIQNHTVQAQRQLEYFSDIPPVAVLSKLLAWLQEVCVVQPGVATKKEESA